MDDDFKQPDPKRVKRLQTKVPELPHKIRKRLQKGWSISKANHKVIRKTLFPDRAYNDLCYYCDFARVFGGYCSEEGEQYPPYEWD